MCRVCIYYSFSRIDYLLHQLAAYLLFFSFHLIGYLCVVSIATWFFRQGYKSRTAMYLFRTSSTIFAVNAINPFIATLGTFIFSHFYYMTWHRYTISVRLI